MLALFVVLSVTMSLNVHLHVVVTFDTDMCEKADWTRRDSCVLIRVTYSTWLETAVYSYV